MTLVQHALPLGTSAVSQNVPVDNDGHRAPRDEVRRAASGRYGASGSNPHHAAGPVRVGLAHRLALQLLLGGAALVDVKSPVEELVDEAGAARR